MLERVKDYWGNDLNVNVGQQQLRRIALRIFPRHHGGARSLQGRQVDWRTENSAKNWATSYDFPAVKDRRVIQEEFPIAIRA